MTTEKKKEETPLQKQQRILKEKYGKKSPSIRVGSKDALEMMNSDVRWVEFLNHPEGQVWFRRSTESSWTLLPEEDAKMNREHLTHVITRYDFDWKSMLVDRTTTGTLKDHRGAS